MTITDVTVHPKDGCFVVIFTDQSGNNISVTLYAAASPGLTSDNAITRARALLATTLQSSQADGTRGKDAALLEEELEEVVMMLATNRWPFRLHATYDESISLTVSTGVVMILSDV